MGVRCDKSAFGTPKLGADANTSNREMHSAIPEGLGPDISPNDHWLHPTGTRADVANDDLGFDG